MHKSIQIKKIDNYTLHIKNANNQNVRKSISYQQRKRASYWEIIQKVTFNASNSIPFRSNVLSLNTSSTFPLPNSQFPYGPHFH